MQVIHALMHTATVLFIYLINSKPVHLKKSTRLKKGIMSKYSSLNSIAGARFYLE